MADSDVTRAFNSGLDLEIAFIELKSLTKSYSEINNGEMPCFLFTLDRAIDRFEVALSLHQSVLHREYLVQS